MSGAAAAETTSSTGTAGPDDDTKPMEGALAPKKQYPWIAARIDAEYYQAQVQDLAAHAAPSAQAIEGTRAQPRVVTATWRACFYFFGVGPFVERSPALHNFADARRNWYGGTQLVSTDAADRQQLIKGAAAVADGRTCVALDLAHASSFCTLLFPSSSTHRVFDHLPQHL
jgi:hypothetical protein